jgi:hypothetical protein
MQSKDGNLFFGMYKGNFVFTILDKEYLSGFIKEMVNFTVYEFSGVEEILEKIEN